MRLIVHKHANAAVEMTQNTRTVFQPEANNASAVRTTAEPAMRIGSLRSRSCKTMESSLSLDEDRRTEFGQLVGSRRTRSRRTGAGYRGGGDHADANTSGPDGLKWHDGAMGREVSYYRVEWNHQDDEYPVALYSALDKDGWEVRKVDV
jgi:hypothetical protein